jgi:hypothetical protein
MTVTLTRWTFLPSPRFPHAWTHPTCRVVRPADLDPVEPRQIPAALTAGTAELTVEEWLEPGLADRRAELAWVEPSAECPVEWWDIVQDGVPVGRIFTFAADALVVFAPGSTERIAQAQQFGSAWEGFEGPFRDLAFREALAAAHLALPDCELSRFYAIE